MFSLSRVWHYCNADVVKGCRRGVLCHAVGAGRPHDSRRDGGATALLGGFGGVLQVDVYGFVAGDGGYVGVDFPVEAGWEELSG